MTERILILAPHPDDEIVACGVAAWRLYQQGAQVFVRWLTDGVIPLDDMWLWDRRRRPAQAVRRLAQGRQAVAMMGAQLLEPDPNLPARGLWRQMDAVAKSIQADIAAHAPTQIWVPAYEGGNPDHDALNAIGAFLAGEGHDLRECAEYHFAGGRAHSHSFVTKRSDAQILTLTPEERAFKRRCLDAYVSEKANLGYVKLEQESLATLHPDTYDYTRPPHPDTVWYARHHWVPFRHPRVDFTRPEQVCAAIGAFFDHRR